MRKEFDADGRWAVEYEAKISAGMPTVDHDEILPKLYIGSVPVHDVDMNFLKAMGVTAILDLCLNNPAEESMARERGMQYFGTFVVDGRSLSQKQFDAITGLLARWRDEGHSIYVHCHGGLGRAPTAVAAYLVSRGVPATKAFDMIEERRSLWVTEGQRKGVSRFEARLLARKPKAGQL